MDVLQLEETQQPGLDDDVSASNVGGNSIKAMVPSDEGSLTSGTSSGSSDFFVPDSPGKLISDDDEDYTPPKVTVASLKNQTAKNAKKTPAKKNTVAPVAKKTITKKKTTTPTLTDTMAKKRGPKKAGRGGSKKKRVPSATALKKKLIAFNKSLAAYTHAVTPVKKRPKKGRAKANKTKGVVKKITVVAK